MQHPIEGDTDIDNFIEGLRHALAGPLPGVAAQSEMAPVGRQQVHNPPDDVRRSAVLALLHGEKEYSVSRHDLALVFTLRPISLRHHGGQISFPGGGAESHDNSLVETALRETSEELGIPTGAVEVLGSLTPLYIAPSHNLVQPYVGWLPQLPRFHPDPVEVSQVLDVRLHQLLETKNVGQHVWHRHGEALTAPCYRLSPARRDEEHHIWGATAMILSELLSIIRPLLA